MSTDQPKPPIVPEHVNPKIEDREDVKKARVREISESRRLVRQIRSETMRKMNARGGYSKAQANREYLEELKNLISELESIYTKLGGCPEYWQPDKGEPLVVLERPPLSLSDVLPRDPRYANTGGYPPVENPEELEPKVLGEIKSLRQLMSMDIEVPYQLGLVLDKRNGKQTVPIQDTMLIPRTALDRARRWCLEYCEQIGLSFGSNDDRSRHVIGGEETWQQ